MIESQVIKSIRKISESLIADIIIYNGDIDLIGTEKFMEVTQSPQNPNAFLILCTSGGDPHAAYKIARRLQERYSIFYLYVYGYCKSAGTLIAVGADEIIMGDFAEFGPLDVQLLEKDEMMRISSGLNIEESLRTLKEEALIFFRSTLIELIDGAGLSTKTAAELATRLALGFVTPIIEQIDPSRVGETQRAIKIALAYGERLISKSKNLSIENLARLIQNYPDHSFVIDFEEAKSIFKKIRKTTPEEKEMGRFLNMKYPSRKGQIVLKLSPDEEENAIDNPRGIAGSIEKGQEITS